MFTKQNVLTIAASAVLVVVGCATSSRASAESGWSYVVRTATGDKFYIDYSTIRRQGDSAQAWFKQIWSQSDHPQRGAGSARVLREFDCVNDRVRILSITAFTGASLNGDITASSDEVRSWHYSGPQTVDYHMLSTVCK